MSDKPITEEAARKLFEESVRILREDKSAAAFKRIEDRLDRVETSTRKEPQTPEEKAAAWDEYIKTKNAGGGTSPPKPPEPASPPSNSPVPPPQKGADPPADPKKDWWWGDRTG